MDETVSKIISYLNIGESPTVVSFPDDGAIHLYDVMCDLDQDPQNYDSPYTFCYLSSQAIAEITTESIEKEIDREIALKTGGNLVDSLRSGFEIVVFMDDIELHDDPYNTVFAIDTIIKKYKNRVKFVYLIETPSIKLRFQKKFPVAASIFDSTIYFKVGSWSQEQITKFVTGKTNTTVSVDLIEESSKLCNNHFGLLQRIIKDSIVGSDSLPRYLRYLLNNFTEGEILVFKKLLGNNRLDPKEQQIIADYSKVGFVENNRITIPILEEYLKNLRIETKPGNPNFDINMELFTIGERLLLRSMKEQGEISKEEIATIIWGASIDEKYSEWAIEQRISRLRKKLKQLGYNFDVENSYNRGYRLVSA